MAARLTRASVIVAVIPVPKARVTRLSLIVAMKPNPGGGLMLRGIGS